METTTTKGETKTATETKTEKPVKKERLVPMGGPFGLRFGATR